MKSQSGSQGWNKKKMKSFLSKHLHLTQDTGCDNQVRNCISVSHGDINVSQQVNLGKHFLSWKET